MPGMTDAASRTGVKCSVRPMPLNSVSTLRVSAHLRIEMPAQRRLAFCAQPARAILDDVGCKLGHARGRRPRPRRERKHMQMRQPAFLDQIERAGEHVLGFGREAGDDVAAEHHVGPQAAHLLAEGDGIGAQVPALHPLQDEIVARLQRQVQMRHQPFVARKRIEQGGIGFDRIDRREPQPLELRHVFEDLLDQRAKLRRARKIGAVAGEIDAGEDDFAIAARAQRAHLRDHLAHRHRTRIAAAIGDDAEGAAVVAAVLHLHEGARVPFDAVDEMRRRLRHHHDVVDGDLLLGGDAERRARQHVPVRAPGLCAELLLVAQDQRDLGHVREAVQARSAPRNP